MIYLITAIAATVFVNAFVVWSYITHVLEGLSRTVRGAFVVKGAVSMSGSKPGKKGLSTLSFSAKEYIRITWSGVSTGFCVGLLFSLMITNVFLSLETLACFGVAFVVGFLNVVALVIKTSE